MNTVACGSSQTEATMYEEPRREASVGLVALPTAVSVGRMFVANTLHRWRTRSIEERMQRITAELVGLSVQATGPAERITWTGIQELSSIHLRMLGFEDRIIIEVVDSHHEPLFLAEDDAGPEDRGLPLVDALAARWGSFIDPVRGRVMWAAIALHKLTNRGLPKRVPTKPVLPPPTEQPPTELRTDLEAMRRVVEGLRRL